MSLSHFDEKSGIVSSKTEWGIWWQTVSEVTIQVLLETPTKGKEVSVTLKPNQLKCFVRGQKLFEGVPFDTIVEDESTWTIEDKTLLRIQMTKANSGKDQCWSSLLKGQYQADSYTMNEMRKKLDLEQFQIENPGFDFSGAKLDKRYEDRELQRNENSTKE